MTVDSHQSARDVKKLQNREQPFTSSPRITPSLELMQTLNATCKAAVDLLGVRHSSLVFFSPNRHQGKVWVEYPELGFRDLAIKFDEIAEDLESTEPKFFPDVAKAVGLGGVRELLLKFNIASLLVLPIVNENNLLGYFALDMTGRQREHIDREIRHCEVFSTHVAMVIGNAHLYAQTRQRAEQLEALRLTTLAITHTLDRHELLNTILKQATELLRAKDSGILDYNPDNQESTVIVNSSGKHIGTVLRLGEGMAGQLARSGERYMIVNHYEQWVGRSPANAWKRPSGAVLEVRLLWQDETVGFLYVEDDVGRHFTEEDAKLLMLFADQAAIAMENSRMVKELKDEHKNLASLNLAAQSLSGRAKPEQVLDKIARQAMESMGADSATIWPYDRTLDGFLQADLVTVGIDESMLKKFREQIPPRKGISHAVLKAGWLGIEDLVNAEQAFIKNTPRREMLIKMGIRSFQGVALKVGKEPVGVLYLNYEMPRRFNDEDRRQFESHAAHASLALVIVRTSQLFEERKEKLREQRIVAELSYRFLGTLKREEILNMSVKAAREVVKTDLSRLFLFDRKWTGEVAAEAGNAAILHREQDGTPPGSQASGFLHDETLVSTNDEALVRQANPIIGIGLRYGVSAPISVGSKSYGFLTVDSRKRRDFTKAEEETLRVIANHTASALKRLDDFTRKEAYLHALHEAHTAIDTESGRAIKDRNFDKSKILTEIVKQAVMCLVDSQGQKASLATLRFYDDTTNELSLDSVHPQEKRSEIAELIGKKRTIVDVPKNMVGYAGLVARTGEPLLIDDVRKGKLRDYYFELFKPTQSELAVPMLSRGHVIGVLNVESDSIGAFDETDLELLQSLADVAVNAIGNAEQYKQLRLNDRRVDARSKIAFMGMANSIWGHSIRGSANKIREMVRVLRSELEGKHLVTRKRRRSTSGRLSLIEKFATEMLERPVIEPLGSDKVEDVPIKGLIKARVRQMRQPEPFIPIHLNLDSSEGLTVRCNPPWLWRALDILLENAVTALLKVEPERRSLTISTTIVNDKVRIAISDTGPGIPPDLLDKILHEPIEKPRDDGGSGLGLLMAEVIFNTYGGDIEIGATNEGGTTMVVSLPISKAGASNSPASV